MSPDAGWKITPGVCAKVLKDRIAPNTPKYNLNNLNNFNDLNDTLLNIFVFLASTPQMSINMYLDLHESN
jgi:hypothetical protein